MKFDLEKAIRGWKKTLKQQPGLEPGYIEEIASHLRDRIDDYLDQGKTEEEAFHLAQAKSVDNAEVLADEYFIARTNGRKTPPWKRKLSILYLMPNYLKIAVRNFSRKSVYTAINLIGLVLGILGVALAALYIQYETSFDQFHSKADQLYRVARTYRSQDYSVVSFDGYNSSSREAQLQQVSEIRNLPGVEDACHFFIFDTETFVETLDKRLAIDQILSTNTPASFLAMFDWPFLLGDASAVKKSINRAVLTRSAAEDLYGPEWASADILSEIITIEDTTYLLAGVIEDIPKNSHYEFNILLHQPRIDYWGGRTYVELTTGADPTEVARAMDDNMALINTSMAQDELFAGNFLQPITSIHLNSNILYEMKPPGDVRYLYVFGLIGLVIILITIANYTNLSIAMNSGRNREIGLRKALGAARPSLVTQFLMESVVMTLIATPLVLLFLQAILPWFNTFMQVSINNLYLQDYGYFLSIVGAAIAIGLIAGMYPAFFLSSRKIKELFTKDSIRTQTRGFSTRKLLITVQLILLIGLISATYFINQQMSFIKNKDLGYRTEGILYVNVPSDDYEVFRNELIKSSAVSHVGSGSTLGTNPFNQTTYKLENTGEVFDDAYDLAMDQEAVKAYGLKTTINESPRNEAGAPNVQFLINETAAEKLALGFGIELQELIGKQIILEPEYVQEDGTVGIPRTIAGFFDDINLFSLRERVKPYFLSIYRESNWRPQAIIAFESNQVSAVMDNVQAAYDKLGAVAPLSYEFQQQRIASLYEQEERIASLTIYLSLVAAVLAIVGLAALTAYLTSLKRKEVGIRKVMGATVFQIIYRFNHEYLILILIALLVSSPLAYYGISKWFTNFAYSISINPIVFILAAVLTLAFTLVAVSTIAYQAAVANPVKSLRDDQ